MPLFSDFFSDEVLLSMLIRHLLHLSLIKFKEAIHIIDYSPILDLNIMGCH